MCEQGRGMTKFKLKSPACRGEQGLLGVVVEEA